MIKFLELFFQLENTHTNLDFKKLNKAYPQEKID